MTILVACPVYRGKSYALESYLNAYCAFSHPADHRLFMVDNTRGTLSYTHKLRALGIETEHIEPMPAFWNTMEICWKAIAERAHDLACEYIASIEADVICPPETLDVLLAGDDGRGLVAAAVPQADQFHFPGWGPCCTLVRTNLLYDTRYLWSQHMELVIDSETAGVRLPAGLLAIEHLHDPDEIPWQQFESLIYVPDSG
jgi:hypothetical protein